MLLSKLIKNEKGSLLILVMVVAASISGFAIYLIRSSDKHQTLEEKDIVVFDRETLLTDVKLILQTGNSCKLSLNGSFRKNEIHKVDSGNGVPVSVVMDNGTATPELKFKEGSRYYRLKISSLKLYMDNGNENDFPEGETTELGNLVFLLNDGSRGDTLVKFPLSVSVVSGPNGLSTIRGCRVPADPNICESVGMIYDDKTGYCSHGESCDLPEVLALPDDEWTGEVVGRCGINFNSHLKEIGFGQMRTENNFDTNSFEVRCCHPQTKMTVTCLDYEEINEAQLWVGERDALCADKPGGILNNMIFTQSSAVAGGNTESNGLLIQCCYP